MFKGLFKSKKDEESNKQKPSSSSSSNKAALSDLEQLTANLVVSASSHTYIPLLNNALMVAWDAVYRCTAIATETEFVVCGHNNVMCSLTLTDLSPSSDFVAMGFMQGQGLLVVLLTFGLRVWNIKTGQAVFAFGSSIAKEYTSLYCPTGTPHFFVGTCNGEIFVFEMQKKQICNYHVSMVEMAGSENVKDGGDPTVKHITGFPIDPNAIVAYSDQCGLVKFYLLEARSSALFVIPGHTLTSGQRITTCSVTAGGKYIFGGTNDGVLYMWREKAKDKTRRCAPDMTLNVVSAVGGDVAKSKAAGGIMYLECVAPANPTSKDTEYVLYCFCQGCGLLEMNVKPDLGNFSARLILPDEVNEMKSVVAMHFTPWPSSYDSSVVNFLMLRRGGRESTESRIIHAYRSSDESFTLSPLTTLRYSHGRARKIALSTCFDPDGQFMHPYNTKKARWPDFGGGVSTFADRGLFEASPTMIVTLDDTNTLRMGKWMMSKGEIAVVPNFVHEDVALFASMHYGAYTVCLSAKDALQLVLVDMYNFEAGVISLNHGSLPPLPNTAKAQSVVVVDTIIGKGPYIILTYPERQETRCYSLPWRCCVGVSPNLILGASVGVVNEAHVLIGVSAATGGLVGLSIPDLQPVASFAAGQFFPSPVPNDSLRYVLPNVKDIQSQQFEKRSWSQLRTVPVNSTTPLQPIPLPEKLGLHLRIHLWSFKLHEEFTCKIIDARGGALIEVRAQMDPTGLILTLGHDGHHVVGPQPPQPFRLPTTTIPIPTDAPEMLALWITHDVTDYFFAAQRATGRATEIEDADRESVAAQSYDTTLQSAVADVGFEPWKLTRTRAMLQSITVTPQLPNVIRGIQLYDIEEEGSDSAVVCDAAFVNAEDFEDHVERNHIDVMTLPYSSFYVAGLEGQGLRCIDFKTNKISKSTSIEVGPFEFNAITTASGWGVVVPCPAGFAVYSLPDFTNVFTYSQPIPPNTIFATRALFGDTHIAYFTPNSVEHIVLELAASPRTTRRACGYTRNGDRLLPFEGNVTLPPAPQSSSVAAAEQGFLKGWITSSYDTTLTKLSQIFAPGMKPPPPKQEEVPQPVPLGQSQVPTFSNISIDKKREDLMRKSDTTTEQGAQSANPTASKIKGVNNALSETKNIMNENQQLLQERGERISRMQDKSADMAKTAEDFQSSIAKFVEKEKNKKWYQI